MILAALMAVLAGPAAAQGAAAAPDPAAMAAAAEACVVEANRDPAAERACVGQGAAACLDAAAEATPEVAASCTAAEAEGWRMLAASTAGALVAMAEGLGVGGEGQGGQAALVARAQRAWAEFRDADCAQLAALAEPGAAQDGVVAECRLDRSAERALALLARRRAMESP
ncbi:lysozyme inhibitor LprI family protein [Amaricoccus sp.]|uniref:lysozyme inhibitor LprI family protein n=1 Tax=Amaricoccus sp. TaxID=1872485 RepID=UPI001B7907C1|nr:lysozyme inhibitor LprI family protein [Amaricoccus sp.]MBP7000995.1 DUF1311 domain-containing protein [Amaricoccus sp.]